MEAEDVVDKVVEETELEEDEVKQDIEEKMSEFEGLVSEEGAAHLVAKEHGVNIAEAGEQELKIKNIVPEMRKVNVKARVVNITDANTFTRDDGDEGKVQNLVLGDDTGTIRLTLWDEQTQIAEKVEEGDAIEVAGAYTVEDDRENAELRLGDDAQVKKADEDEVPEVETQSQIKKVDVRDITSEGTQYQVSGMVMDIYTSNPFYNRCPECGDTVREDEDGKYVCEDHDEVEPDHALAISGVLDDGTGNIRFVMFRDQARNLLEIDEETEKEGDVQAVEDAVENAVGKEIVLSGRTRYNDYFDRLEIIGNSYEKTDPEQEIEDLTKIMTA